MKRILTLIIATIFLLSFYSCKIPEIKRHHYCKSRMAILLPQLMNNESGEAKFTHLMNLQIDYRIRNYIDNEEKDSLQVLDRKFELIKADSNAMIIQIELELITNRKCDCASILESSFENLADAQQNLTSQAKLNHVKEQINAAADSISKLENIIEERKNSARLQAMSYETPVSDKVASSIDSKLLKEVQLYERFYKALLEKQAELNLVKISNKPLYKLIDHASIISNQKTHLTRLGNDN